MSIVKRSNRWALLLGLCFISGMVSCTKKDATVKEVMDKVIAQLYKTTSKEKLAKLDNEQVMALFSNEDKEILATRQIGRAHV